MLEHQLNLYTKESERLAGNHTALQRAPTDLPALARQVVEELRARHPAAARVAFATTSASQSSIGWCEATNFSADGPW